MPTEATPTGAPHPNDLVLDGETGSRDENKISTVNAVFSAASFKDVLSVGGDKYHGLVESGRSWTALNDNTGGFTVVVTYKGYLSPDGGEGGEPTEVETEQWSADFDYSEEPIEAHPKFERIKKVYNGVKRPDGTYQFSEVMPKDSSSKGLGGKTLSGGEKNPMFGVSTYALLQARVSRTFSTKRLRASLVAAAGSIKKTLPNAPEQFEELTPGDRNWMCMPPKITQNGDVFRVEESWLLSPPGGWPPEVYELLDA